MKSKLLKGFVFFLALMIFIQLNTVSGYAAGPLVGDVVEFGKTDGSPMKWRIIHIDGQGHALLFSENIVKFLPYNVKNPSSDWEVSTARSWLNAELAGGFLDPDQFTSEQLEAIRPTKIKTVSNELITNKIIMGTEIFNPKLPGSTSSYTYDIKNYLGDGAYKHYETMDKVFLLSIGEFKDYVVGQGLDVLKKPTQACVDTVFDRYSIRLMSPTGELDPEDADHFSGYFLRGAFHGQFVTSAGEDASDENVPYISNKYSEYPGKVWPEVATYENFVYTRGIGYAPALYLDLSKTGVYKVISSAAGNGTTGPVAEQGTKPLNDSDVVFDLSQISDVSDLDASLALIEATALDTSDSVRGSRNWRDQFALFIENALIHGMTTEVQGMKDNAGIVINQMLVDEYEDEIQRAIEEVRNLLDALKIHLTRPLRYGFGVAFQSVDHFTVRIEPHLKLTGDSVVVNSGDLVIKFNKALLESLTSDLIITVKRTSKAPTLFQIELNQKLNHNIEFGLRPSSGNHLYQVVVKDGSEAVGGKFNPGDGYVWFKAKVGGTYGVEERHRVFSDISTLSEEAKLAISVLASKGIINGTSQQQFSPGASISRAEIAALILKTVAKIDHTAPMPFRDVTIKDWYFTIAASAKKAGIMNGVDAYTFAPKRVIPKDQIIVVAARTLRTEMGYFEPTLPSGLLSVFKDQAMIQSWSTKDIAYAMEYDLVPLDLNGFFNPSAPMTRGDAAIVLYRLFNRLW